MSVNTKILHLKTALEAKHGPQAVMMASEIPVRPRLPSGSLALDFATGGGLPSDRLIEVFGEPRVGKTTLALLALANALDANPKRAAVIADLEHKLESKWLKQLIGPQRIQRVIHTYPDTVEDATDIIAQAISSGDVCFVLFDSIGGAPSQRVLDKSAKIGNIGGNSLGVTRFSQIARTLAHKRSCLVFCVNQVRADMEGFHRVITPGGHGIKHDAAMRIHLKRATNKIIEEEVDGEKVPVGYWVAARVVKNQVGGEEGRTAGWWFHSVPTDTYGFGVDTLDEVVRLGIIVGTIEQRGGWYAHPALPGGKAKGLAALRTVIDKDESLRAKLTKEIMASLANHSAKVAPIVAEGDLDPDAVTVGDLQLP